MAPSELTAAPELETIAPAIRPNIPKQQKLDPIADPPVNADSSIIVTKPIPTAQPPAVDTQLFGSVISDMVFLARIW